MPPHYRDHPSTVPIVTIAQDRSRRVGDTHQAPVWPWRTLYLALANAVGCGMRRQVLKGQAVKVVDKSWGLSGTPGFRVRSNASPADRAAERARARDLRGQARSDATTQRLEARAASREADTLAREQARLERREREMQAASGDPHAAAAKRHRSSGRKDVLREQRDTRSYTTVVDEDRIRVLADRGASIAGLAGAFGITEEQVQQVLAAADQA